MRSLALLANFDKSRERGARYGMPQDRMGNAQRLQRRSGKAATHRGQGDRNWKSNCPPPCQARQGDCGAGQRQGCPPGGLAIGGEVTDDPEPERDRQPG